MSSVTKSRKTDVVMESLDAFKALRMTLAYLRCITASFNKSWRSEPFSPAIRKKWNLEEGYSADKIKELTFCYHTATMIMHLVLVHDVLCHYRRLVSLNSNLRYEAIDKVLEFLIESGVFEEMRQIRNGVFHIRTNANVINKFLALVGRLEQQGIYLRSMEDTFYEYSEFLAVESDIFQRDRKDLLRAFDEAVEYYKTHVEPNLEPGEDEGLGFMERGIIRPDKMF